MESSRPSWTRIGPRLAQGTVRACLKFSQRKKKQLWIRLIGRVFPWLTQGSCSSCAESRKNKKTLVEEDRNEQEEGSLGQSPGRKLGESKAHTLDYMSI